MSESDNNQKPINKNLDDQGIELLIDKKIADAKVMVAEKRLNFLLAIGAAFLTIFGIIIPMFLSLQSEEKVNKSIEKMEVEFKELAGRQLRKPEMALSIDGQNLMNQVVHFNSDEKKYKTIVFKNIGDGSTEHLSMRLYLNSENDEIRSILGLWSFDVADFNDKPEFKWALQYGQNIPVIPAKDSFSITFGLRQRHLIKEDTKATVILKVFYGEPTPLEVPFFIEINKTS